MKTESDSLQAMMKKVKELKFSQTLLEQHVNEFDKEHVLRHVSKDWYL